MLSSTVATRIIDPTVLDDQSLLEMLSQELSRKKVVAMSTDTVFGLIGQASSCEVTDSIAKIKGRPTTYAMPVLIGDPTAMECLVGKDLPLAEGLAEVCDKLWPGPLTVVVPLKSGMLCDSHFAQHTVGLRVPDNERLRELARRVGPLVATSANLHGEKTPNSGIDVYRSLSQRGSRFGLSVVLDEVAATDLASTVVDFTGAEYRIMREGKISLDAISSVMGYRPGK